MQLATLTAFSLLLAACQSLAPGSAPAKAPSVSSVRTWQPTPPERSFRPCAELVQQPAFRPILEAMEKQREQEQPAVQAGEEAWRETIQALPSGISEGFKRRMLRPVPVPTPAQVITHDYSTCVQLTDRSFLGFSRTGGSNFEGLVYVHADEPSEMSGERKPTKRVTDAQGREVIDELGRIIRHGTDVVAEASSNQGERVAVVRISWSHDGAEANGYELLRILPDNTFEVLPLVSYWNNFGCATAPEMRCWPPRSELLITNRLLLEKYQFDANDLSTNFVIGTSPYNFHIGTLSAEPNTGALVFTIQIKGRRLMQVNYRLQGDRLDHAITLK